MGKARIGTKTPQVTLDASALIAIDRGDRRMLALLDQVLARGGRFQVPAGALWSSVARRLAPSDTGTLSTRGTEVDVVPLDDDLSRACGEVLAATGTSDVIDASIVLVARSAEQGLRS